MSKLDELIQELCPDGVEYKYFGEVATIARGASPRPIKNFVTTDDDGVNWIKIGDVRPGSKYITETAEKITPDGAKKSRFVKEGDFILSNSMSFGRPYIMKTWGCVHDGWLTISNFNDYFISDFLYHLLSSNKYQQMMRQKASFGGAVQNLNADIIRELGIPIVPLEIQREIVRILDNFTELIEELKAELIARKKQYEYYKQNIFDTVKGISTVKITDIALVKARVGWQRLTKVEYLQSGDYYLITGTDFVSDGSINFKSCVYVSEDRFNMDKNIIVHKNDILITKDGTLGKVAILLEEPQKPTTLNSGVFRIHIFDDMVLPRYLFHFFTSKYFTDFVESVKTESTIPHLTQNGLLTLDIPLPSLEKQEEMVRILDKFSYLTTSISTGLPAEIEARQKQYEYYRDKLLTFEKQQEN